MLFKVQPEINPIHVERPFTNDSSRVFPTKIGGAVGKGSSSSSSGSDNLGALKMHVVTAQMQDKTKTAPTTAEPYRAKIHFADAGGKVRTDAVKSGALTQGELSNRVFDTYLGAKLGGEDVVAELDRTLVNLGLAQAEPGGRTYITEAGSRKLAQISNGEGFVQAKWAVTPVPHSEKNSQLVTLYSALRDAGTGKFSERFTPGHMKHLNAEIAKKVKEYGGESSAELALMIEGMKVPKAIWDPYAKQK